MKKDKINTYTSIFAILMLLIVTINATYAYFTSKIDYGNGLSFNITTEDTPTFTAYAADQLSLNVTAADMASSSTTASKTDTASIIATLASSSTSTVFCTYDIILVWDSANQYTTPTTTLTGDYKYEISMLGLQTITNDKTGHNYSVTTLNETNLTAFTWTGTAGTVGRSATIIKGAEIYSNSTTPTQAKWDFTINFYSLPTDQSALLGQNYGAHLAVTNVVC